MQSTLKPINNPLAKMCGKETTHGRHIWLDEKGERQCFDYDFQLIEDYNIDRDDTDYIIEWRQKAPVAVGE